MQLSTIITEVKRQLKEPMDAPGHWIDDDYVRRANLVQTEITRNTMCFDSMEQLMPNSIYTAAQKPSNCLKIIEIRWKNRMLTATNERNVDMYAQQGLIDSEWRTLPGSPIIYIPERMMINLYPQPVGNYWDTDNYVKFYRLAEDMTSSESPIMEGVEAYNSAAEAMIAGMMVKFLQEEATVRGQMANMIPVWENKYKEATAVFARQLTEDTNDEATFIQSRAMRLYPDWVYFWRVRNQ